MEHIKPIRRMLRGILAGLILVAVMNGGDQAAAEERLLPFNQDLAVSLLEKILAQKVVGREFAGDGIRITMTRLNRFAMDWQTSRFMLDCEFQAGYQKGFIALTESGEVSLEGTGLISAEEQKLGVEINRVNSLRLYRLNATINALVARVLDKMLAGKAYWPEVAPAGHVVLTKDNLDTLIQVALNRVLPQTVSGDHLRVTLHQVQHLAFRDDPGGMDAVVDFEGEYHHLLKLSCSGRVGAALHVMMDPDTLAGIIRVRQVTELKVDRGAGLFDGILRRMLKAKLEGKEVRFSWK